MAQTPPITVLFAAFLGYDPVQQIVGPEVVHTLPAHAQAALTTREFFPQLISGPFEMGLHAAFVFAIVMCLIAAAASAMRGRRAPRADAAGRAAVG